MARVVPVGPLDAELYGFAKKEAERAERDPRYKPKNCPAERGQIIYKRIGAMVKALVIAYSGLIGVHRVNFIYSYIPHKSTLKDEEYDSIPTSHNEDSGHTTARVDGTGDWYWPTYWRAVDGVSKTFSDIGQSASKTEVSFYSARTNATYFIASGMVGPNASSVVSTLTNTSIKIRIHEKYLGEDRYLGEKEDPDDLTPHCETEKAKFLRGELKFKTVHELEVNATSSDLHVSADSNGYYTRSSNTNSQSITDLSCGRKLDKYIVLFCWVENGSTNVTSGSIYGYPTVTITEKHTPTYKLYVNGELKKTIPRRLGDTVEHYAMALRIDGGGLMYVVNIKPPARHQEDPGSPEEALFTLLDTQAAYRTLTNKYGVFIATPDYVSKIRKREDGSEFTKKIGYWKIVWARPKEAPTDDDEGIHLLDNDNSEFIVITPEDAPKFGEKDGKDYPGGDQADRDVPYMLFATTRDKNSVIAIDDAWKFDLSPIVRKYTASKGTGNEMSIDDVQAWRGVKTQRGVSRQLEFPNGKGADGQKYMAPEAMEKTVRPLIDALYFPPEDE
jgi:hypothetical protein